jgi:glycosyltransferase A (GT-A) superfamily protein (DUF2064 family)
MTAAVLVIAKAPVPGRVKTRLCPPCTPRQAAAVAEAALRDTLDTVSLTPAASRTLVLEGRFDPPPGWLVVDQRGAGLAERLANAFADAPPAPSSLLIGMDTPQVTPAQLVDLGRTLDIADAVMGPAEDGGWWALGLRDHRHAELLRAVPMSAPDTGRATMAALVARGLRVAIGPTLRDVDTAPDAHAVARQAAGQRFRRAVRDNVGALVVAG